MYYFVLAICSHIFCIGNVSPYIWQCFPIYLAKCPHIFGNVSPYIWQCVPIYFVLRIFPIVNHSFTHIIRLIKIIVFILFLLDIFSVQGIIFNHILRMVEITMFSIAMTKMIASIMPKSVCLQNISCISLVLFFLLDERITWEI
jgi:hypothetical protein